MWKTGEGGGQCHVLRWRRGVASRWLPKSMKHVSMDCTFVVVVVVLDFITTASLGPAACTPLLHLQVLQLHDGWRSYRLLLLKLLNVALVAHLVSLPGICPASFWKFLCWHLCLGCLSAASWTVWVQYTWSFLPGLSGWSCGSGSLGASLCRTFGFRSRV